MFHAAAQTDPLEIVLGEESHTQSAHTMYIYLHEYTDAPSRFPETLGLKHSLPPRVGSVQSL